MKKMLVVIIAICFLSGFAVCEEKPSSTKSPSLSEGKILDLGEPTPEEISQMGREEKNKYLRDSGFADSFGDTMEEMEGDDSKSEFDSSF